MVQPVVQNEYILSYKPLSPEAVRFALAGFYGRERLKRQWENYRSRLVSLLGIHGFTDNDSENGTIALKNDLNGIEVYLSPIDFGSARVTIAASKKSYGINPQYLDTLVANIDNAEFNIKEINGKKRVFEDKPYDWTTQRGKSFMAGDPKLIDANL